MGGFPALIGQVTDRGIVPRIARLAAHFRALGLPVIHLTIAHRQDFADVLPNSLLGTLARKHRMLVAGTPEADIIAELTPAAKDFVVERSSGLIGFLGTSLDAMLRRMRIDSVVITGVSTNVAVTGCAMVGADLGYHVVVAEDCIAASDPAIHDVIVNEQLRMIARISTAADVEAALKTT
ncbi:nicotinamidase-related amidase [Sphingobium sp. OAS761]|nr:nicotinamidase-related amidase [Sphingobium sp. OAS761]